MADLGAAQGLSGHAVRGAVEAGAAPPAPGSPEAVADASARGIEETIKSAVDFTKKAIDLTGEAIGKAVDLASDKAFQDAADVGPNIANTPARELAQASFSWSGYLQAIGIMCVLLAALWFAVWAIRKWGKFNFLPRPGSLPRDSLVMEAQMPLGPKKGLMVVRFMNRRLLLGVTEHQITLLTEDKPENERKASSFESYLDHSADSGSGVFTA